MCVGGRRDSLSPNFAKAIGMYTDIGRIALMYGSGSTSVVLKTPQILRSAAFCAT